MNRRFFIYAMPRSGSAWLANFLTTDRTFCAHEPLADGYIDWGAAEVSGAICTAAAITGYQPPNGVAVFSLSRRQEDANKSLARIGLPTFDMSAYPTDGFVYECLFDVDYLERLWAEITGLPFNRRRAEMLVEMNVQRDVDMLLAKANERVA